MRMLTPSSEALLHILLNVVLLHWPFGLCALIGDKKINNRAIFIIRFTV